MIQKKIRSLIYAGLGLVLCVLLCGGIGMTAQAYAEDEDTYNGFQYFKMSNGVSIDGYIGDETELVIPEEIDGVKVTCIGENAFWGKSNLTSITIPESVTWIRNHAFSECKGITSIIIPANVDRIDFGVFSGCDKLENITVSKENKYYDSRYNCNAIIKTSSNTLVSGCGKTVIPKDVTSIGDYAFSDCIGLTSITIPESVTSIGYFAFNACHSLTSITMAEGLTDIGDEAFFYCTGLTSITIPKSVTSIGSSAFDKCNSLTSITIPEGVTKLERSTFNDCSSLTSVTLPKSLTSIRGWAFDNCSSLTSIIIPDGVTCISFHAFANCSKLTYVAIPDSVTEFEEYDVEGELLAIFENSPNVTIICNKDSAAYKYATEHNIPVKLVSETENPSNDPKQNNTKPATPAKKGTTLTVVSKKLKVKVTSSSKKNPTVTITKFTDKKAKKLTIPATVKVKGVTYKVTAVSDKAFKGNKKLTTVTIGSNVAKIGKEAFSSCKNLKKITVTAGKLKTISKNAFKGINKKATITVKGKKKAKTALKKQLKKKSIGYVKTWKIK